MNVGLKCTLWALILIQMGGMVKELYQFKISLFQGTISSWTIDSWTGVGYLFVISTSVKQV